MREVLESHTFARSEQLRNFLRYVCEKTVLGQAGDMKEYSIGVDALGRPPNYSPSDDSSVRRRAYELRQRLEEYYAAEAPDARVRIDLPKGSYVPVFVHREPSREEPQPVETPPGPPASKRRTDSGRRLLVAFALGAVIGAGLLFLVPGWRSSPSSAIDPVVREVWGPLLEPGSRTLICLGSTLHMLVRTAPFRDESNVPSYTAPTELHGLYAKSRPLSPDARLFMRPVENAASIGVISGVAVAAGVMRAAGVEYQILPERTAPLASFRGRNVLLFGDALTSHAAGKELEKGYFTVAYDESGTELVIRDRRKPPPAPAAFSRKPESSTGTVEAYGLITVLPTVGSENERTFVISGVSNAGIHGALEFLASPDRLRDLKERFARQGLNGIPAVYQVVVRCTAASTLLLSYEYAGHEVIDRSVR